MAVWPEPVRSVRSDWSAGHPSRNPLHSSSIGLVQRPYSGCVSDERVNASSGQPMVRTC